MKDLSDSRVLIVDDVKANVDVLVEALRNDHKLSVALDGEAALRSIEKNAPDLVLLDIVMPGLDGYEVCKRLRANPNTAELPVMFLSSLDEVKNKTQGFEVGGNDYLTKPFEVLEVKARVRSLLKAKAYSDAVKEKMAAEMAIAKEIQLGILPSNVAKPVAGSGFEVCAVMDPARDVGGDLYEVLRLDDGRILAAVGDVSGKGMPAALFMAVTTTLLRATARHHAQPADIVRQVNDALYVQNPRNMFVTMLCMIIDPKASTVTAANAGHPSPLLLRDGSEPKFVLESNAMIAGILPNLEIGNETLQLAPGDSIVVYTDGVTEAFNPAAELFGDDRLLQVFGGKGSMQAKDSVSTLVDAVRTYAAGAPQSDDITVMSVQRSR